MQKRKLTQILAVLKPEERKEFADFLRSPLHTHRPKLAGMIELMERKLFLHSGQQISSEDFYAAVYPGKKYDANDLNRSISVINRELKSYLAFVQYRQDKGAQYGYYVKEVGERKWPGGSIGAIREVRKRLDTEIEENPRQYLHQYELEVEESAYWVANMPKNPGLLYQKGLDRLDEFYLVEKLKTMILAKNHDLAHNTTHDYRFSDAQLDNFPASIHDKKLIRLYHQLFVVKSAKNVGPALLEYVETLRKEIPHYDSKAKQIDPGPKLVKKDAEILYGLGLNQARVLRTKEGNKWVPVIQDIFSQAIVKGVFLEKGKLYDRLFINHIQTLCSTGFAESAESFFTSYNSILESNFDNSTSDFCKGFIHYFKGEMKKSRESIGPLKNRLSTQIDPYIVSGTRILICALWYEAGEMDLMVDEAHAFRSWINRDTKRADIQNKLDKGFCKMVLAFERAVRGPEEKKKTKLQKLQDEVLRGRLNGRSMLNRMLSVELEKE